MTTLIAGPEAVANLAVPNVMARQDQRIAGSAAPLTIADHLVRIASRHPDEWPAYMADAGMRQAEIDAAARIADCWLDAAARESLSKVAREAHESKGGLNRIMETWCRTEHYAALEELIAQGHFAQPEIVWCYAVTTATELALAMLTLHGIDAADSRRDLGPGEAPFREEDEFIASLSLAEDMLRWPE